MPTGTGDCPSTVKTNTGITDVTILDGFIFPIDPTDPAECFGKTHGDYVGTELLMVSLGGKLFPLHLCGDTNTGMNFNGCSHGEISGAGSDPSCLYTRTGEKVTAQACVLDGCAGYVLDATQNPYVIIAEIDGLWYIVNVITGVGLPDTADLDTLPCPDACCGADLDFLEATISGCGVFNGLTFEMASGVGGGTWTGQVTAGGETFSFSLSCPVDIAASTAWTASGGCLTSSAPSQLTVECAPTGTDAGNGKLSGFAVFPSSVCTACSGDLQVSFVAIDKTPKDNCRTIVRTGVKVVAEACGLNNIQVGSDVIIAEVPENTGPQWQVVQVCQNEGECPPCPPPPPPEELDCCDFDEDTVPLTLSGTLTISGVTDCDCTGSVSFAYVAGSNPPEWNQVGTLLCPDATGTSGASISDVAGLVVKCSGVTGTASPTGTGVDFFLTPQGCASGGDVISDQGQCEPMYAKWVDVNIDGCCGPLNIPQSGQTLLMTLEISE